MDEATFRSVVAVAVGLGTVAMGAQAVFMFLVFRAVQATNAKVTVLSDRAEPVIDAAHKVIEENRPRIAQITTEALEVVTSAREQMARIEEVVGDATDRARVQLERLDLVLNDTVERVHETASTVQNGILRPVREVSGVMNGVRAAISTLAKGQRTPVANATQDEEMFI